MRENYACRIVQVIYIITHGWFLSNWKSATYNNRSIIILLGLRSVVNSSIVFPSLLLSPTHHCALTECWWSVVEWEIYFLQSTL